MSRFTFPERNAKIVALRRQGVRPIDIAHRMEISGSAVAGVLFRAGLTDSFSGKARGRGCDYGAAEKSQAVAMAASCGSAYRASRELDIPRETIRSWIQAAAR